MSQEEIYNKLASLSEDGQAWVADILPFPESEKDINYLSFKSISRVPDRYKESSNPFYEPKIGWMGGICNFK